MSDPKERIPVQNILVHQARTSQGDELSGPTNAARFWQTFRRHRLGLVGLVIVGAIVLAAVGAPYPRADARPRTSFGPASSRPRPPTPWGSVGWAGIS